MYKIILDMVYAYTDDGNLKLIGYLNGISIEEFLMINKKAFI